MEALCCDVVQEFLYEIAKNPDVTLDELDEALEVHGVPDNARGVFHDVYWDARQSSAQASTRISLGLVMKADMHDNNTSAEERVRRPAETLAPDVKNTIIRQYSYIAAATAPSANMVMPAYLQSDPKKGAKKARVPHVRYLDGRAVTTKGEKYVVVD